jgi:hypothetical protein
LFPPCVRILAAAAPFTAKVGADPDTVPARKRIVMLLVGAVVGVVEHT